MNLYHEILEKIIREKMEEIKIPSLAEVEGICCLALQRIKEVLSDDTLSDPQCFERIERIVCILEEIGCDTGGRHDF